MRLGLLYLLLQSSFAWGLVDYSEQEPNQFENRARPVNLMPQPQVEAAAPAAVMRKARDPLAPSPLEFRLGYESMNIASNVDEGKLQIIDLQTRIRTPYNLYLDLSYWYGAVQKSESIEERGWQKGNPKILMGVNWLKFGRASEASTVDFLFGFEAGSSDSLLASSRNDKILGVQTTKRFHSFVFGLGFEYTLTGTPENDQHLDIGNMRKLKAAIGWVATDDIRLSVDANTTVINTSNSEMENRLREEIKFATVTPKLTLLMSSYYSLELGANFRTRRSKTNTSMLETRVLREVGSYGNSVFMGLNMSI